jgi:AraC-like DNA-binding protein
MKSPSIGPFRFTTRGALDPVQMLRGLNEREAMLPFEPLAGAAVQADIVKWSYPELGILWATVGGLRQCARAGQSDRLYVGITLAGRSGAAHRRGELALADGEAVVLSTADGFAMACPEPARFLGLRLERAALATHVRDVDDAVMRRIPRYTPALRLLTGYIGIVSDGSLAVDEPLHDRVVNHIHELVSVALDGPRERAFAAGGDGIRAARLRAIQADVLEHIAEIDLSAATVAASHGITPRYVHKLFACYGTTFSEFVLRQRLDRVHRLLSEPRCAGHSISALAFDAGFNDVSYFNRAFRRQFGARPSDVRHGRHQRRAATAASPRPPSD